AQLVRCDHHAAAQVDPPRQAQRVPVELAEDALAAVAVRAARGDFAGALVEAKPVVAQARAIGYPPLLARALARTGSLEAKLADPQAAADLREATEVAARARDDRAGFAAWSTLLQLAGTDTEHPDKLDATLTAAQAAAARTGEDADPAQIELYRGQAELTANKLADGERSCKQAYDAQAKLYGSSSLELRGAIHCMATAFTARGEYAGAKEWLDRAFAIDRDTLGADHPDTAEDLDALSDLQLRTGHFEEGLATSNKALAIRERTFGKDSDQVSQTLLTMGNLLVDSGHAADGEPKLRRSLAIATQIHGVESRRAASAMAGLGMSLSDQHHYKEARVLLEHAIAIDDKLGATGALGITLINLTDVTLTEKKWDQALALAKRAETALVASMGADSSIVGFALFDQARALNELHRYDEAVPLAEHAMAIAKTGDDPDNLASFQLALAMALGGANRDLPRAIELARTAHATFVKIGHTAGSDESRDIAAAFLRAHGAKP
ncbi:MAG TPA: tetratricopeptide repeat protein, partial [Kofleriaceae bacterium]|nr:tetratricopeptide repeat protein [Kofleriaceae bacterium]